MVCQVLSSLGLEDMAAQLDVPALLLTALGDRCEAYGDVSDTKQAGERDPFSIAADLRRLDHLLGEEAKDEAMAEAATVGVGTGAEAGCHWVSSSSPTKVYMYVCVWIIITPFGQEGCKFLHSF